MKISLIQVPWDSGHFKKRMGLGPVHIVEQGLIDHLKKNSVDVELTSINFEERFSLEIGTAKVINTLLAEKVKLARSKESLPIILAGNCNTSIGTTAGLGVNDLGVIWFDAHADFNTPETSLSGFFDGMSLSILTGNCWKDFAKTIPGFKPIDESRIVLAGARDIDGKEDILLKSSSITHLAVKEIRGENFLSIIPSSIKNVNELYIHIDLDVFDPSELTANKYSVDGGLLLEEFIKIIESIRDNFKIAAIAFTAYDPSFDTNNSSYNIVTRIIQIVV